MTVARRGLRRLFRATVPFFRQTTADLPRRGLRGIRRLVLHYRFAKKRCPNHSLEVFRSLAGFFMVPKDIKVGTDIEMRWPFGAGNLFVEHVNHWFAQTSRRARLPICPVVMMRQFGDHKLRRSY